MDTSKLLNDGSANELCETENDGNFDEYIEYEDGTEYLDEDYTDVMSATRYK